jgi:hypothetical protein
VWDEDELLLYHSDYLGVLWNFLQFFVWLISDTTYNAAGEIIGLKTETIFPNLVGAHGASYDEYSKTILFLVIRVLSR